MTSYFDFFDARLLVNVADTGSLGRGAEKSFLSPSAATNRVKHLEDALGVKLLYRNPAGVTLTPAGSAFVAHARNLLAEIQRLHATMKAYECGLRGHVRLWANTTAMNDALPAAMAHFMTRHPEVDIELRERLSGDIVRAVQDGAADMGIVAGDVHTDGLEVLPYCEDRLVLVTGVRHALAGEDAVDFAQTLRFDQVSLGESSAIHQFLLRAAAAAGLRLSLRIEVNGFDSVCRLVEAGVGIGVIPESAALHHARHAAIRIVQLRDAWAERHLRICVRDMAALPSFARDLVEILRQMPALLTSAEAPVAQSQMARKQVASYA
jgi:DNA-binding transcriptional LysR family regulator